MKYYSIGVRETTGCCPQGYTAYSGFDYDEAKKAYEKEKYNFEHNYTDSEKANNEVFAMCYTLPDDIDITDEDEVTNAVRDCICCKPIK